MGVKLLTEFVSKDAATRPWGVDCDTPRCYYHTATKTQLEAIGQLGNHQCPARGPLHVTKTGYERLWVLMDASMGIIMDGAINDEAKLREKAHAEGLAEGLLSHAMFPFETLNDIKREALARHKMATGQIPWRVTPGCIHDYKTVIPDAIKAEAQESADKAKADFEDSIPKPPARGKQLTDQQIIGVKAGLSAGMSAKDLAGVFRVSEETINSYKVAS